MLLTASSIREEMKTAMRSRDELKLSVLRGILAACTNELVSKGKKPTDEITDDEMLGVLKRLHKQRTEAADQFAKGNRPELKEKELAERAIIEVYLPAKPSREEIERVAQEKINELGVKDISGMGKLIGAVMKQLGPTADGNEVKVVLAELLK